MNIRSVAIGVLTPALGLAQISTDGSVGPVQTFSGSQVNIPESTGARRGANLFHSFDRFNVSAGQSVTFNGTDLNNVLVRVSGTGPTRINGTLRNAAGRSRLFIINGAGISVGNGAVLDSPGGMVLSTAPVRFSDGFSFDQDPSPQAMLSSAAPEAFGFVTAGSGVTFEDVDLRLPNESTLAVVGGDVSAANSVLRARRGTISMAALTSSTALPPLEIADDGSVRNTASAQGLLPYFGNIRLDNTTIDIDGAPSGSVYLAAGASIDIVNGSRISNQLNGSTAGGSIELVTGQGTINVAHSTLRAGTLERGRSGGIRMRSGTINIESSELIADSGVAGDASAGGPAGDIDLGATSITLLDGARLSVGTFGPGEVGQVRLDADTIVIDGQTNRDTGIFALTVGTGAARTRGLIQIDSDTLTVRGGATINTSARGPGGAPDTVIRADDVAILDRLTVVGSNNQSAGQGGSVIVAANNVLIDGATLTSSTLDAGPAGRIRIGASGDIRLTNGATIVTDTQGPGAGGRTQLEAARALLDQTSEVSARTSAAGGGGQILVSAGEVLRVSAGSQLITDTSGPGAGGFVSVLGPDVWISGVQGERASALLSRSTDARTGGPGGAILIKAARVRIDDGALVSAATRSPSPGGGVQFEVADRIFVAGGPAGGGGVFAGTSSTSPTGQGGSITTIALTPAVGARVAPGVAEAQLTRLRPDLVLTRNAALSVSSSGSADAGNVRMRVGALRVDDGSLIVSRAENDAAGGTITLIANQPAHLLGGATLSARSDTGAAGTIELAASDLLVRDSFIDVGTRAESPGKIVIYAPGVIEFHDSVVRAAGNSAVGSVKIDPTLILLDRTEILTVAGNPVGVSGGDILLSGDLVLQSTDSTIQSVGRVDVDGIPDTDITAALVSFNASLLDQVGVMQLNCSLLGAQPMSSFVVEVRGGAVEP